MSGDNTEAKTPAIEERAVSAEFLLWLTKSEYKENAPAVAWQRVEKLKTELSVQLHAGNATKAENARLENTLNVEQAYAELSGTVAASICHDIIIPLTLEHDKCRFCDLPLIRNDSRYDQWFGKASFFVSYAWTSNWEDIVEMLCDHSATIVRTTGETPFYWIDLFAVCQHDTEEKEEDMPSSDNIEHQNRGFRQVIGSAMKTVVLFDHWKEPKPLSRAWCLFEMWATVDVGADLQVLLTKESRVQLEQSLSDNIAAVSKVLSNVNLYNAESSQSVDKERILALIEEDYKVHNLNVLVNDHLRQWIVRMGREMLIGPHSGNLPLMRGVAHMLLRFSNRREEALHLFQEVAVLSKKVAGCRDTDLKDWREMIFDDVCVARAHKALGQYEEAKELYIPQVKLLLECLGLEDALTLEALAQLAGLLHRQSDDKMLSKESRLKNRRAAEKIYEACLAAQEKVSVFSPQNDIIINTKSKLATLLIAKSEEELHRSSLDQTQLQKAEDLLSSCYDDAKSVYGADAPLTLKIKAKLGSLRALQASRQLEAIDCLEEAWNGQQKILGRSHRRTIETFHELQQVKSQRCRLPDEEAKASL